MALDSSAGFAVEHSDCLRQAEPIEQLPSTTELPIPRLELPAEMPFSADPAVSIGFTPPPEALLALTAVVVLAVVSIWRRRRHPRDMRAPSGMSYAASAKGGQRLMWRAVAVVLVLLAMVPTAFWGLLAVADHQHAHGHHLRAVEILSALEPTYPAVQWVQAWRSDNPARQLAEVVQVAGIVDAVERRDLARATALARSREAQTAAGRRAQTAAYLAHAASSLAAGEPAEALYLARSAARIEGDVAAIRDAVAIGATHLAAAEIFSGRFESARQIMGEIDNGWHPEIRATLGGLVAFEETRALFAEHNEESEAEQAIEQGIEIVAAAWTEAIDSDRYPAFIACGLGGLYEALALREFAAERPAGAVAALSQAESFVERSPLTASMFPRALRAQGLDQLHSNHVTEATKSLEQALDRWLRPDDSGDLDQLRHELTTAWLLRSRQEIETKRFEAAAASAERACVHSGNARRAREAVASARLAWADEELVRGHWSGAREKLEAVRSEGVLQQAARMRQQHIGPSQMLLQRLRQVDRWASVPEVDGAVAVDVDGDHSADVLVLGRHGNQVGSVDLHGPRYVTFSHPLHHDEVYLLIDDRDGDGVFDEVIEYQDDGDALSLLDLDGDHHADLELTYENDRLVWQKALSGRVAVRLGSVVIGDRHWDPPWAGGPDPYLEVSMNGSLLLRTPYARNTFFPTFSHAVAIDYRHGQEVRVDVWDKDWIWDDWIDALVFDELPSSGIFKTSNGRTAIEIRVTPAELPHGYTFTLEPVHSRDNLFLDESLHLPEVADLVASAKRLDAEAEIMASISSLVLSEVLVMALMPQRHFLTQLAAGLAVDAVVLEPMLRHPGVS